MSSMFMRKSGFSLLSTCCLLSLFANPENGIVIEGRARFESMQPSELVIHTQDRSIIHWDSFSIDSHETTRFIQGSQDYAVLNRVTGDQMSQLLGSLISDGKIFLINPNGIIVGKEGVIDVASFVASSFDISNSAFLSGEDFVFEGESLHPLANEGIIRAKNGDILMLASRVENKGTLSAPVGEVMIGAGQKILVGVQGKKSLYVSLPGDGISNEGNIEALRTVFASSGNPYSLGIQNKGRIDALQIDTKGGEIFLRCEGASLLNDGILTADKGSIQIEAENSLFENRERIESKEGSISIKAFSKAESLAEQKHIANYGQLDAGRNGTISITAPKYCGEGSILTEGGSVSIFVPGTYIETAKSTICVGGGNVKIVAGSYSTSGKFLAKGESGGAIAIETERFLSTAGIFDASGASRGGSIKLSSASLNRPLYLNSHVVIDVSGSGGTVELLSPLPVSSNAVIKLDFQQNLSIPSSLSGALDRLGFADPNQGPEPLLWTAIAALRKEDESGDFRLASCPPSFVELIDPNHIQAQPTSFGTFMLPLASGNVVVTKPDDDLGGANAGAVYLFNAGTGAHISTLLGSHMGDQVGSGNGFGPGAYLLTNGNYVVASPNWQSGGVGGNGFGAATWGSAETGMSGSVSSLNSLVGTAAMDQVTLTSGTGIGVTALTNGNYVIASPFWAYGSVTNAGAATWGNGETGTVGEVSAANSLIGTQMNDRISSNPNVDRAIAILTNGNYVVSSPDWDNDTVVDAGAATWGNGLGGTVGVVSPANSLVGTQSNDQVSSFGITALANGNYAIASPAWDNGAVTDVGAATWGNGATGRDRHGNFGAVSSTNSLIGSTSGDTVATGVTLNFSGQVRWYGITPLTNSNYVVASPNWENVSAGATNAGAATWINGATGLPTGPVTVLNSLVGSTSADAVSEDGINALTNGNYVVASGGWDNASGGTTNAGAATWVNGMTGMPRGNVSETNSIIGLNTNDHVAAAKVLPTFSNIQSVVPLTNGNFVVLTPNYFNGGPRRGAATWGNGATGTAEAVSPTNSFVGVSVNDKVSLGGVTPLTNGNFVIASPTWRNTAIPAAGAGAATWGNGSTGADTNGNFGPVSESNSLVGTQAGDNVPLAFDPTLSSGITALSNGNYVVLSVEWANGTESSAGAVSWGNGATGQPVGPVSATNSLVGTQAGDQTLIVIPLSNSNYLLAGGQWQNLATGAALAGAVTFGNGETGTVGEISSANSLVGTQFNDQVGGSPGLFLIPKQLSSLQFVVPSPQWADGANMNAGAVTLGSAIDGTFCDAAFGSVSSSNSFLGTKANAGLNNSVVLNDRLGNNYSIVQFLDYLEATSETRVFSIAGIPTPSLSPSVFSISPAAKGIHDFAIAITEYFTLGDWLTLKDLLSATDIYPPLGTFKRLQQRLPSLVVQKDHYTTLSRE